MHSSVTIPGEGDPWAFAQARTLPIGCLSYRSLNFELKTEGPHSCLGAAEPCSYAIIPCNIIILIFLSVAKFKFPAIVSHSALGVSLYLLNAGRQLLLHSK